MYRPLLLMAMLFSLATYADSPLFIDVRSAEEFQQGHVEGALLIPHENIVEGVAGLGLAPDTPVYLYCRSGRRAGIAAETLRAMGFTRVINLETVANARSAREQMLLCAISSDAPACSKWETPPETVPAASVPREG